MVKINSVSALLLALGAATGGERLELAPGNYAGFGVRGKSFVEPVTITAADPTDPPVFGMSSLFECSGINIDVVTFAKLDAKLHHETLLKIDKCSNVNVTGSNFVGTIGADGEYLGYGVSVGASHHIDVNLNRFNTLARIILFNRCDAVNANGNDVDSVRIMGISFHSVRGGLASANAIRGFKPMLKTVWPGKYDDHPDGIFIASEGADYASEDITIEDNLIVATGGNTQGIFARNQGAEPRGATDPAVLAHKETLRYKRIRYLRNLAIGTMFNGLSISRADDVEIIGNRALHIEGTTAVHRTSIGADGCTGRAEDNEASSFMFDPPLQTARNKSTPSVTPAEAQAAEDRWLAEHRQAAQPSPSEPPPADDRDAQIASLKAELAALTARIDKVAEIMIDSRAQTNQAENALGRSLDRQDRVIAIATGKA